MKNALFNPMIELLYRDLYYGKRHITIILNDVEIEDELSKCILKIKREEFEKILEHHFESFKSFEKYARDNKLGIDEFIDVTYKQRKRIFIPLGMNIDGLSTEVINDIQKFEEVIFRDLFQLCRYAKVSLQDVVYEIEEEIKSIEVGDEFSFEELFAKDRYKCYIDTPLQALNLKQAILNDKFMKNRIDVKDELKGLYVRVNKENEEPWSNPFENLW